MPISFKICKYFFPFIFGFLNIFKYHKKNKLKKSLNIKKILKKINSSFNKSHFSIIIIEYTSKKPPIYLF